MENENKNLGVQSAELSKTEHSPLPWRLDPSNPECVDITSDARDDIAHFPSWNAQDIVNADFIIRACNSHDALLRAAEFALKYHKMMVANGGKPLPSQLASALVAALSLAKEEK